MIQLSLQPGQMTPTELKATAAYLTALAGPSDKCACDEPNRDRPVGIDAARDEAGLEPATVFRQEPPVPVELTDVVTQVLPDGHLDSEGLPWDARIHASTKALVADGSWRKKRGVDDATVAQVTAELKVASSVPPAPAPIPVSLPVPPPPTVPPVPANTPAAPQPLTFAQILPRISAALLAGTLDVSKVAEACQSVGIPALPALAGMPHLIPQVLVFLGLDSNG